MARWWTTAMAGLVVLLPIASVAAREGADGVAAAPTPATVAAALGGGLAIDLPAGWTLTKNPSMMPPSKDFVGYDYRIRRADVVVAMTGFGFAWTKPDAPPPIDIAAIMTKAVAQYLPQAREAVVEPVLFANGPVGGGVATLHAADGKAFAIGVAPPVQCVTSLMINGPPHKQMTITYSVTIGSDDCDGAAHRAAQAAVMSMRLAE